MRSRHFLPQAVALSLIFIGTSCGESGEVAGPGGKPLTKAEQDAVANAHGAALAQGEVIFSGEVRMTEELANADKGVVWLYARKVKTRSPLLIKRYPLDAPEFQVDGADRVLGFAIRSTDTMMSGMTVELPPDLELKIEYDPDGLVETKEGTEAVVMPVAPGSLEIKVILKPGMAKPKEVPSNFPAVVGEAPADSTHGK
ncbi:MAG: hypothetical protein ACI841_001723 [Planctomycetota bacterium]|jgi:hypothetical protein